MDSFYEDDSFVNNESVSSHDSSNVSNTSGSSLNESNDRLENTPTKPSPSNTSVHSSDSPLIIRRNRNIIKSSSESDSEDESNAIPKVFINPIITDSDTSLNESNAKSIRNPLADSSTENFTDPDVTNDISKGNESIEESDNEDELHVSNSLMQPPDNKTTEDYFLEQFRHNAKKSGNFNGRRSSLFENETNGSIELFQNSLDQNNTNFGFQGEVLEDSVNSSSPIRSSPEEESFLPPKNKEIVVPMISVKPDHLLYRSKLGSDSDEDDTDASKESEENSNAKSQGLESNEIYDISDSEDDDVIEVKQPQEATSSQSIMLEPRLIPTTSAKDIVRIVENPDVKYCTQIEYSNQASIVANLRTDLLKCKNTMRTMNLDNLPDKGARLKLRVVDLEQKLFAADSLLKKMYVETKEIQANKPVSWEQLKTNAASVIPRTLGERAMQTYATQKALTMDRLKSLHDSLATCPADSVLAEDPKGLKVELMTHQKRALAWLIWREHQKPSGGILADDMGLGKTLTMISLVAYRKQQAQELDHQSSDSETENGSGWRSKSQLISGGTLVICPATLIRQWEAEVDNRCKRHLISVELYHGVKRENKAARLAKYDMVITTYKLAMGEFEKKGPLFRIKWKRIILDEAHVVRNHKSQTSLAVCGLSAVSRWTLTGTPVHNKELDLYALLKFLRCHPFDDIAIWKHWVANKNAGGQERLNTVMTSILLRRTKEELQNNGALKGLPERKYELIQVDLDNAEKQIYQKVLVFSRTLFVQFLHQRKEKDLDVAYANPLNNDDHLKKLEQTEYLKMHQKLLKMSGTREVQSHEILVLLLRLRQICCHPSLIIGMLNGENEVDDSFEEDTHVDLIDKINNMKLDDNDDASGPSATQTGAENITNKLLNIDLNDENEPPENFGTAINKVLSLSNPVFAKNRPNEKIRVIKKIITEKVIPQGDKLIIVSQWTSMLNVVYEHLKADSIRCDMLDGKVPVPKRNEMVVNFNDPKHRTKVLLLSLTAGGVGLNLVGANHLILLDLHWNPQLESQAQDRIYRVGQKKTVVIYKLVTTDTIEERIKALQEHKLSMASDILSGTRTGANKLTLDDLKMLFS